MAEPLFIVADIDLSAPALRRWLKSAPQSVAAFDDWPSPPWRSRHHRAGRARGTLRRRCAGQLLRGQFRTGRWASALRTTSRRMRSGSRRASSMAMRPAPRRPRFFSAPCCAGCAGLNGKAALIHPPVQRRRRSGLHRDRQAVLARPARSGACASLAPMVRRLDQPGQPGRSGQAHGRAVPPLARALKKQLALGAQASPDAPHHYDSHFWTDGEHVSMARRPACARRRPRTFRRVTPANAMDSAFYTDGRQVWYHRPMVGSCPYRRLNPEPPCKAGGRSVRTANRCCVAATPSGPSRAWTIPMAGTRRTRRTTRWAETPRPMSRASWRALPRRTASPWGKGLRLRIPAPHPGARAVVRPRARQPVRGWRIRLRSGGPRPAAPGGRASRHDDGPGRAEPQQRADLSSRAGNPAPARCRHIAPYRPRSVRGRQARLPAAPRDGRHPFPSGSADSAGRGSGALPDQARPAARHSQRRRTASLAQRRTDTRRDAPRHQAHGCVLLDGWRPRLSLRETDCASRSGQIRRAGRLRLRAPGRRRLLPRPTDSRRGRGQLRRRRHEHGARPAPALSVRRAGHESDDAADS